MNQIINWETITQNEAEVLLENIKNKFNLVVKLSCCEGLHDVSYFIVKGLYDDNFHGNCNGEHK